MWSGRARLDADFGSLRGKRSVSVSPRAVASRSSLPRNLTAGATARQCYIFRSRLNTPGVGAFQRGVQFDRPSVRLQLKRAGVCPCGTQVSQTEFICANVPLLAR